MTTENETPTLLEPSEVAQFLGIAEQTLALWRSEKRGPDYVKLGKAVFYRQADVTAWIAASVVKCGRPVTDQAPA